MTKLFEAFARDGVIVLPERIPQPARCLVAVLEDDFEALRADADYTIPEASQQRMSELLEKNRDSVLTNAEQVELDALAREFDAATLSKGRALSLLAQLDSVSPPT
jgi:hypothetical protein